jgi:hypothetical protein
MFGDSAQRAPAANAARRPNRRRRRTAIAVSATPPSAGARRAVKSDVPSHVFAAAYPVRRPAAFPMTDETANTAVTAKYCTGPW